jgi:hypothetical protein
MFVECGGERSPNAGVELPLFSLPFNHHPLRLDRAPQHPPA